MVNQLSRSRVGCHGLVEALTLFVCSFLGPALVV